MNREEIKKEAKKDIDNIFDKMDELESKKNKIQDNIREKYESTLSKLRKDKNELQNKYKRLNEATENTWMDASSEFKKASNHFKQGISELTSLSH